MWVETITTKAGITKYKFQERYTDVYSGKTKRVSVTYASNSRQAYKLAQSELQKKIDLATNTDIAKDMTLNDVISEYLESKRAYYYLSYPLTLFKVPLINSLANIHITILSLLLVLLGNH